MENTALKLKVLIRQLNYHLLLTALIINSIKLNEYPIFNHGMFKMALLFIHLLTFNFLILLKYFLHHRYKSKIHLFSTISPTKRFGFKTGG